MLFRNALAVLCLAILGSTLAPGCNAGGDSGTTCTQAADCPTWRCTCHDGQVADTVDCSNGECTPGHDQCTQVCYNRGGLASFETIPDLTQSDECAALCAKIEALPCGGTCNKRYWCNLAKNECADAKRALLACEAAPGALACDGNGNVTVSSACPSAACATADAGSDAAPDAPPADAAAE